TLPESLSCSWNSLRFNVAVLSAISEAPILNEGAHLATTDHRGVMTRVSTSQRCDFRVCHRTKRRVCPASERLSARQQRSRITGQKHAASNTCAISGLKLQSVPAAL